MADSDDGSQSRRESHYNQQRSSAPSTKSLRSRSGSRPQSAHAANDFTLQDDGDLKPPPPLTPSPPPIIPRRKHSLDNGKSPNRSRRGSARSIPRTGSRNRNIDAMLVPDSWDQLNQTGAPAPNISYRHSTVEEERTESRESRGSGRSAQTRSIRSALRLSASDRRATPRSELARSELDITALPMVTDAPGMNQQHMYSQEYERSKATVRQQKVSRFATDFYTISYLIFFSILGTLARVGIQWLTFYPGAPVNFSNLWANFSGTIVMGFLAEDRRLFRFEWGNPVPTPPQDPLNDEEKVLEQIQISKGSHLQVKKTIPLYIGLTTGFCGSFTSFSSFMRDVFFALSNDMPSPINHYTGGSPSSTTSTVPRNGGYSFMAILAVIIITITVCYSALKVGAHFAIAMDPFTPTLPFRFNRRVLDPLIAFLAWGAWLGAVVMSIVPPDRPNGPESKGTWANETWRGQALFACVFAPLGCLLRYYISLWLNGLIPTFPLGTFAVNVFGTAVLGMAFDLQHVSIGNSDTVGGTIVGCQVLQGLMDGFCGALTTVSTWMTEIQSLRRGHAYTYASASVAAGLAILVIVMGSVRWSVGWHAVSCVI